jgi:hypothetical protein
LKGRIYYYVQKKKQNFVDAFGVLHDAERPYAFGNHHSECCGQQRSE